MHLRTLPAFGLLLAATLPATATTVEPELAATKDLMVLVEGAAELIAEEGVEAACREFREEDSSWYSGESYVFVLDMDGQAICHPAQPTLEGRDLSEMRDPAGRPIMGNMLRELESSDDGWVHYQWRRPGGSLFYWKTTHVRRARHGENEYVVGSGRYQMPMERFFIVEQVDDAVALIEKEGAAAYDTLRDDASGFLFYSAYVFVVDSSGVLLVNKAFPENEGRNLIDMEDIDGRQFVREMLAVPEDSAKWIHYKWPKPGDTRPSAKSSYVRRLKLGDDLLVVGAGVYFDIEPAIRELGPASDVE